MTGEGGHNRNWACGCKPRVLGPPVSPIPPMLRSTIEQVGYGPPLSWKLEQDSLQTKLALKWTTNTRQTLEQNIDISSSSDDRHRLSTNLACHLVP
jgi:hypothetical protein